MEDKKEQIDFKSQVLERKDISISMEVEIDHSIMDEEIRKLLNSLQKQVKMPGFRQGKAPMDMIKNAYLDSIKNDAVENIIKKTVFIAMKKENFEPIDIPTIDELDYKIGDNLKYHFTAECAPNFEVKDYKEIPIQKEIFKITDKKVGEAIDGIRERNSALVPSKSDKIMDKSIVYADYDVFETDGAQIRDLSVKNFVLDLSSDRTLKEFKAGLAGAKTEEERGVKIKYEDSYPNKLLAGKEVLFKIKINTIKEKELPKLDDDFAKDLGLESLDDLKKKVRESLEKDELERQKDTVYRIIDDYLLSQNSFEIPQCLAAEQEKVIQERIKARLYGYSPEQIDKEIEKSKEMIKRDAQNNVRLSYIVNKIAEVEKLQISDEELEAEKSKILAERPKDGQEYFDKNKNSIKFILKENKIYEFLTANAKITEIVKEK